MSKRISVFETVYIYIYIILCTGAFYQSYLFDYSEDYDAQSGDIRSQLLFAPFYLISLLLIFLRRKEYLLGLKKNKAATILILIPIVSCLWSQMPYVSVRSGLAVFLSSLFGFYLAHTLRLNELVQLLSRVLLFIAIVTILLFFLDSSYIVTYHDGHYLWKGVFAHKNTFGSIMALCFLTYAAIYFYSNKMKVKIFCVLVLFMSFFLSYQSGSTTSILVCLLVVILLPIYRHVISNFSSSLAIFFIITFFIVVFFVLNLALDFVSDIFQVFGKDLTLTNRTSLWKDLFPYFLRNIFFGYGYKAFWYSNDGVYIRDFYPWSHSAHNGLLQLGIDLGLLGLVCFFILYGRLSKKVVNLGYHFKSYPSAGVAWPFLFFLFFTVVNLTESNMLVKDRIVWVLFIYSSIVLNKVDRTKQAKFI